jgi:hypothetical protein
MRNRSPHNQLAVILTLWVMRREPSVERGRAVTNVERSGVQPSADSAFR